MSRTGLRKAAAVAETILNEQRLQVSGTVSDATAVHMGRILGADSVLLYHIEAPNMRDRTLARVSGDLPPTPHIQQNHPCRKRRGRLPQRCDDVGGKARPRPILLFR